MAGGIFHVEFGINETPLTRALESGQYTQAEKLIRENLNPSYLDEGCYQRTPLFICLCGTDETQTVVATRHFYLAKFLIENGANVNHRVPTTYFGSEYEGPGKSALELLTDFYNELTKTTEHHSDGNWSVYSSKWDPQVDLVIGINKQYLTFPEDVIEHIEDLIYAILSNGGDPNVCDECKLTPLHKTAIYSHDARLLHVLCENGANINATDRKGNSPLLSMCDTSCTDMYEYFEDLSMCSDDTLEDSCASLCVKQEFLTYLISLKDLDVNIQNNRGQTALFHCVIRGDVRASHQLLKRGANVSLRGMVWETRKRKRKLSPIFASFLSIPMQRSLSRRNLHSELTKAPQQFSHLVDKGYFNRKEIVEEISEYLEHDFPEFMHLRSVSPKLVNYMFGKTSSSLKQAATRVIFRHCFLEQSSLLTRILPLNSSDHHYSEEDLSQQDVYDEYINFVLNKTVLKTLVQRLNLPIDSLINFEIELLLHRMAAFFGSFKVLPPEKTYNYDSEADSVSSDSTEDSSISSGEGDSDLEYW